MDSGERGNLSLRDGWVWGLAGVGTGAAARGGRGEDKGAVRLK